MLISEMSQFLSELLKGGFWRFDVKIKICIQMQK